MCRIQKTSPQGASTSVLISWAPTGPVMRDRSYGTGAGQVSALVADAGPVGNSYGGQTATTSAPIPKAEQWTIVLWLPRADRPSHAARVLPKESPARRGPGVVKSGLQGFLTTRERLL